MATARLIRSAVFVAALSLCAPALADGWEGHGRGHGNGRWASIPEFDPASAGVVAVVVAGGGVLLARRRKR